MTDNGHVTLGDDVPSAIKHNIVLQELQMFRNSRYQMQLRHRVQKAIGGTAEQLKAMEDELLKYEQAIDLLEEELKAIAKSTQPQVMPVDQTA